MKENKYGFYLLNKTIEFFELDVAKIYDISLYLSAHRQELNNDLMHFLQVKLLEFPMFKTEEFLSYLKDLYLKNPTSNPNVKKYLESSKSSDIYNLFKENSYFAYDLFKNYYDMIIANKEEVLYEPKTEEDLKKEEVKIETLPDLIRSKTENIINTLASHGMRMQNIITLFSHAFSLGPSKLVGASTPEIIEDMDFLSSNYFVFMRIVLADCYACAKSNIDYDKERYENIIEYIEKANELKLYLIPPNPEIAADFFNIYLNRAIDADARKSAYDMLFDEEKKIYQEINPLYILENYNGGRK